MIFGQGSSKERKNTKKILDIYYKSTGCKNKKTFGLLWQINFLHGTMTKEVMAWPWYMHHVQM
jgi:hypothetical protein